MQVGFLNNGLTMWRPTKAGHGSYNTQSDFGVAVPMVHAWLPMHLVARGVTPWQANGGTHDQPKRMQND